MVQPLAVERVACLEVPGGCHPARYECDFKWRWRPRSIDGECLKPPAHMLDLDATAEMKPSGGRPTRTATRARARRTRR